MRPNSMPWSMSGHATQRRIEMGLATSDIAAVLHDAEMSYPSKLGHLGDLRRVLVRGPLAVVVACADATVVTVLWHSRQDRHSGPAPHLSAA